MKRFTVFGSLICLLVLLSGCHFKIGNTVSGSGVRKSEKRDLAAFTQINVTGSFAIEAKSQKPVSVEIEADDNILPLVITEVRNGVLYIKPEKGYNSKQGVSVRITVPDLTKIEATGASNFRVDDVKNDRFEIRTTGASTVVVSGRTSDLEINTTGAGEVDTHSLHAARANVKSSGAATVEVYANEQLDANVSGAGSVAYSGDPKVVNKKTSGAATVSKREESGY
jgi:hypothetical protein